jgi:hypothetical protein
VVECSIGVCDIVKPQIATSSATRQRELPKGILQNTYQPEITSCTNAVDKKGNLKDVQQKRVSFLDKGKIELTIQDTASVDVACHNANTVTPFEVMQDCASVGAEISCNSAIGNESHGLAIPETDAARSMKGTPEKANAMIANGTKRSLEGKPDVSMDDLDLDSFSWRELIYADTEMQRSNKS